MRTAPAALVSKTNGSLIPDMIAPRVDAGEAPLPRWPSFSTTRRRAAAA
jgi:hypothetical protein